VDAWGEVWPWHVLTLTADGAEVTVWRCGTREQANRERDRIQDAIMAGTTDAVAAWVSEVR